MKHRPLSKIAQVIMGQSPPSSSYNTQGNGLPFFQGKADFGEVYPTIRFFCTTPLKIAEAGNILISVRAPVGPTNLTSRQACIGRGLAALRCYEQSDTNYLLYFLRLYGPQLANVATGSTFDAISRDDLETISVPYPSLSARILISSVLTKADRVRRLRQYALELSGTYLQAVFLEMFGDPVTNPKGWDTKTLGDLIYSVQDGPHVSPEYAEKGIPFLSTRNIRPGQVMWEDLKFITHEEAEKHWKKCKPELGDILYTKGGTTGLAKVIDFNREIAIWVHIAVLKPNREIVDPLWLENMLNSQFCYLQSQELTHGIANHDLGLTRMVKIKLHLPPLSLQKGFAQIAQQHERIQAQQREALRQAEHLFQTLLHKAFQGELSGDELDEAEVEESVVMARQQVAVRPEPIDVGVRQLALPLE